jgi:hypothetical protein
VVESPWPSLKVTLGGAVVPTTLKGSFYAFDTKAGATYILAP